MASMAETHRASPFDGDRMSASRSRDLPLISNSNPNSKDNSAEPMDISPRGTVSLKQQERRPSPSPSRPANGTEKKDAPQSNPAPAVGAAAAAQQPKVVQAAFIHKLYNMLEDQSIQHLISWSSSNESFVMSPSTEFSKVLASYFKHTNISSFVRQLNMYGFHKVSDVFHAASPDSPLWEFKHGAGSFKRGDLVGLRDIKRRASRQTLIHRESFSNPPKPPPPPPPAANHTLQPPPQQPEGPAAAETLEQRVQMMDYSLHDVFARLARTDEALRSLTTKCQMLSDGLSKCLQFTGDLTSSVQNAVPDTEHQIHRDVAALRSEIARQAESLRSMDPGRPAYGASPYEPLAPISPSRPGPFDTSRRPSLQITGPPPTFRPPMSTVMASPRRQGSLGVPDVVSPSSLRTHQHHPTLPPPVPGPTQPHPLSNVSPSSPPPSNLGRRHTSADIRLQGWQGGPPPPLSALAGGSPYESGQNSSQWPSSPYRPPISAGDQQLRDALAQYELPKGPQAGGQRQTTPPPDSNGAPPYANVGNEAGWQLPGPKFPFRNIDFSAPPTRRSSMASNVHSLLNPAETAEREEEDGPEDKKRKRMM